MNDEVPDKIWVSSPVEFKSLISKSGPAFDNDVAYVRERTELEPHKAINFLTVLEHQAHRDHEYHPGHCAECSMTEVIANKLREQLGLESRAEREGDRS